MGSEPTEELPDISLVDPGVLADLKRLVVWQCEAGEPRKMIGVGRPLVAALDVCGALLDALRVTAAQAETRLRDALAPTYDPRSKVASRQYAARAMLGLLDPLPNVDTPTPTAPDLLLGDQEVNGGTVRAKGYRFDRHIAARKAFVIGIFGSTEPSGIKRDSKPATEMALAVALALGLAHESARVPDERVSHRRVLSEQLASRLNESTPPYPPHLTPIALAEMLTLSSASEDGEQSIADALYGSGSSTGGEGWAEVVATQRRLVVLGNPGGGKSTVLAAAVFQRAQRGDPAVVVRLSSLAPLLEQSLHARELARVLVEVAERDAGLAPDESRREALADALIDDPTAFVALDGLDEVYTGHIERIHNMLRALQDTPGSIAISSRIVGYERPPGDWHHTRVDSLEPEDAQRFIDLWFGARRGLAHRRATAALATPERAELAQIPVLLGIIAAVAEESDVPDSEAALYDRYVAMFLRGWWKPRKQRLSREQLPGRIAVAGELAWSMATGLTGRADGVRWKDVITFADVVSESATRSAKIARTLVDTHGLFVAHGRSHSPVHQQFRWLHRTVHEHLVGSYLAARVRADLDVVDIPDELLMGPPQWEVSLRHMIGLLDDESCARVVAHAERLIAVGDPGGVLRFHTDKLVEAMPEDAALRRSRAVLRLREDYWHTAWHLDQDLTLKALPAALGSANEHAFEFVSPLLDRQLDPGQSYAHELIAVLRAADRRDTRLFAQAASWLSRYSNDEAFAAVVEQAATEIVPVPYFWPGGPPTHGAQLRAASLIADWPADRRLPYVLFMRELGCDLAQLSEILDPQDVRVAEEMAAELAGDSAGPGAAPLSEHVQQLLLSGVYGDERAWQYARELGYERASKFELCPAARIALACQKLDEQTAVAAPVGFPVEAVAILDNFRFEDVSDSVRMLQVVEAVRECLASASVVSVAWALSKCRQVIEYFWRVDGEERGHVSFPLEAIGEALVRLLAAQPKDTIAALLATDPNDWITRSGHGADLSVIRGFDHVGILSAENLVDITMWATRGGHRALGFVRLGSKTEEVVKQLVELDSRILVLEELQIAHQLAEVGMLAKWRGAMIDAKALQANPI